MIKLEFCKCVLVDSYSVQYGNDNKTIELDGGLPRTRKNFRGSPHIASVQMYFDANQFEVFRKVDYEVDLDGGNEWFLMDLPIDSTTPEEHTVRFVDGSSALNSWLPSAGFISAQLWVKKKPVDLGEVETLRLLRDFDYQNPLEPTVNVLWDIK